MIKQLVSQNSKVLRTPAETVTDISTVDSLITDLFDTLEVSHGVGLAAPQIGVSQQVFVISIDGVKQEFINPTIVTSSDTLTSDVEGCLSLPGLYLTVKRPEEITVMWTNRQGQQEVADLKGMWARVWLHEYDHLNGILIDNRVSKLVLSIKNKKLLKKQKSAQRK